MGLDGSTLRILQVDALGQVAVSGTLTATPGPYSTLGDGTRTVTTAGVPVPLTAASNTVSVVLVQALRTNTANISVGNITTQSVTLAPGEAETLLVDDTNNVYIDAGVNGEGVAYHTLV
jgi:hypothetical protein